MSDIDNWTPFVDEDSDPPFNTGDRVHNGFTAPNVLDGYIEGVIVEMLDEWDCLKYWVRDADGEEYLFRGDDLHRACWP